jgi:hypothetical protein
MQENVRFLRPQQMDRVSPACPDAVGGHALLNYLPPESVACPDAVGGLPRGIRSAVPHFG